MIYLEQNIDSYNNDLRTMLQAFFPGVKIVTNKEETDLSLYATFNSDAISYVLEDVKGYHKEDKVLVDYRDKAAARNPMKLCLYNMLSAYTGRKLPWGTLTGVRPTKIATDYIEKGYDDEAIINRYIEDYDTSKVKAHMSLRVAKLENKLLSSINYEDKYGLYIGIPFCPTRCLYCSFTSYPIASYANRVDEYLEALFKELDYISKVYSHRKLITVYIGGGTPSSISALALERLINKVYDTFDMSNVMEFTVEAGRPDSITTDKLNALKKTGVTRISINPQTMHDETLKLIGRAHTVEDTLKAYYMAREASFDNINMDIIVGLPGETINEVRQTLDSIYELRPESLTVHSLAIKRAANLNIEMEKYKSMIKGSTNEMLMLVDEYCTRMGLDPYYLYRQKNIPGNLENVGYAKEGLYCLYNILIMEEKMDIVAAGAGASSKLLFPKENRIERTPNVKNVDEYISRIDEMIERKKTMFIDR